jgi:hypothetical protein
MSMTTTEMPFDLSQALKDKAVGNNPIGSSLPRDTSGEGAAEIGNGQGSAEMNADKTIVVKPAPATNYGGQPSDHSTVQAKTVATFRGDEPPVPMKTPVTVA